MMLAPQMCAYRRGIYSSRKIAAATYHMIPFPVLIGDQHPHIRSLPTGTPIFRSPEWQANVWAAAFLMPLPAVRSYLARLSATGEEFTREGFAAHFQVSRQAAAIRLEKLLPALVSGAGGDHGRDVTASPSGRS
jgi:hypothetical protein